MMALWWAKVFAILSQFLKAHGFRKLPTASDQNGASRFLSLEVGMELFRKSRLRAEATPDDSGDAERTFLTSKAPWTAFTGEGTYIPSANPSGWSLGGVKMRPRLISC
jgi:hypothetical protein